MNPSAVVVNILINANNIAGLNIFNNLMAGIASRARQTAQDSAFSFDSIFGANFFANLAASMVQNLARGFTQIISDAIEASKKAEAAFTGLESLGKNVGLSRNEASESVKNIEIVRSGLLGVQDAATALKNLLATGFSLSQSIELIKRFGDTAAFGRQSALTFGYAISSATEGIKNQNSILVDNAGVTKNLSVILKERGFQIQDLADKVKGASAREALYQGLIKETNLQQGDATKLLETYSGQITRTSTAYERFLRNLGDTVTQSSAVKSSLTALVGLLDFMAQNTNSVILLATALGILTASIVAVSSASLSALPVVGSLVSSVRLLGQVMTGTASLMAGATATTIAATAGWAALVIAVFAVVTAIASYIAESNKIKEINNDQLKSSVARAESLNKETEFLSSLSNGVASNVDEQKRLAQIYKELDPAAKARIQVIETETEKTKQLVAEKKALQSATQFAIEAEGGRRAGELSKSLAERIALTKDLTDAETRFKSASSLALSGSDSGVQAREERIRQESLAAIAKSNSALIENQQKTDEARNSLLKFQQITGISTEKSILFAQSQNQLKTDVELVRNALDGSTTAQNKNAIAVDATTNAVRMQIEAIRELSTAQDRQSGRGKFIQDQIAEITEQANGDLNKAKQMLAERRNQEIKTGYGFNSLGGIIDEFNSFKTINDKLTEIAMPKDKKPRQIKSEYDSLNDSLTRLRGQAKSFQDLTAKEFKLRFEKENLERTIRDFEKIIDLRRELGFRLDLKLPNTAEGSRLEIEYLERIKSLRDTILNIQKEGLQAEDKLLVARLTANEKVVSAQVRADTAYFEGIRQRANAEQQLSADIIGQIRRREMAQKDSVRETQNAQAEAYRDFLTEQNDRDAERLRQLARFQLLSGVGFSDNPVINSAISKSQSPSDNPSKKLDTTNSILRQILGKIGGSPNGVNYIDVPPPEQYRIDMIPNPAAQQTPTQVETGNYQDGLVQVRLNDGTTRWVKPGSTQEYLSGSGKTTTINSQTVPSGSTILTPVPPSAVPDKVPDKVPVVVPLNDAAKQRMEADALKNPSVNFALLNRQAREYFNIQIDASKISTETIKTMNQALQDQKIFWEQGSGAIEANAVIQDRINQTTTVRIKQTEDLAIGEARLNRLRDNDSLSVIEALNQAEINRTNQAIEANRQLIANEQFLKRFAQNDPAIKSFLDDLYKSGKSNEKVSLTTEVDSQRRLLKDSNDPEMERLRLERERNNVLIQSKTLEEELARSRSLNADEQVRKARQYNSVTSERIELENRLSAIQDASATSEYNQALREQVAASEELLRIRRADLEAREDIARLEVSLADKTVYHQDQANRKVLEHLNQVKSMTDIYADAKITIIDGLFGGIDKAFDKITGKVPIISNLLSQMLSSLTKLIVAPFLSQLFAGSGQNGNGQGNGGGQGGNWFQRMFGGLFSGIFGGNGNNSSNAPGVGVYTTPPFNGNASNFSSQNYSGVFQASSPLNNLAAFDPNNILRLLNPGNQSGGGASELLQNQVNGQVPFGSRPEDIARQKFLREYGENNPLLRQGRGGSIFSQLFGGIGFGKAPGSGGALASMLPLLGASFGNQIGGGSGLGGILGSAGGILAGIGLTAAPTALAGTFLAPLFSNPITAVVGGALLIGSYFIGRNKQRRADEKQRTAILGDAKKQMQDIISQLRSGNLDSRSALAQADQIRQNYIQQVGQLKDSKTRRIALQTVRELDAMIETIKQEGMRSDFARAQDNAIVPTFSSGGSSEYVRQVGGSQFTGYGYSEDDIPARLRKNEVILSPSNVAALGYNRLKQVGVRGIDMFPRNNYDYPRRPEGYSSGGNDMPIYNIFAGSEKMANEIFDKVKHKGVARKMKLAVYTGNDDGFSDTMERKLAGEL